MTLELIEAAGLLGFDAAHGWPATFTHDKAARLQTWRKGMERKAHRIEATTWTKLIELALAAGDIAHTTTTELVPDRDYFGLFDPIPLSDFDDWRHKDGFYFADGKARRQYIGPPKSVTHHHITAPDFAAWLAAKGMEPSLHAAAWFKAHRIGGASAAETTDQRNARWLLVWDKISPDHTTGSQARAMETIAAAENVKPDTVKAALQSADKARHDRYRETGVVTPIKRGKNTANDPFNIVQPKARAKR